MNIQCQTCHESFSGSQTCCPHCGLPSLFPNVTAASQKTERDELGVRYKQACDLLTSKDCDSLRHELEMEIRANSKAVISTNFNELERLAQADTNVFSTYYKRVQAGLQIPNGDKWDVLRGVAEHAAFPGYKNQIRFGALSLDGVGVKNYGECSMELKDMMVAHRTSLFEDNNVLFTVYTQRAAMADAVNLEPGHRAAWDEREKLCIAKLAPRLNSGAKSEAFPQLVLEQGQTTSDDKFIETHIWGSLTIRSVACVRIHRERNRPLRAAIADIERLLKQYNVKLDVL